MSQNFDMSELTFRSALEEDINLQKYKQNALQLFALALYLRVDDIDDLQ